MSEFLHDYLISNLGVNFFVPDFCLNIGWNIMDHDLKFDTENDSSIIWNCSLCQNKKGRPCNLSMPQKQVYHTEHDFKDHYDRTCHICFWEFTSKMSRDQHQGRHSDGVSKECKSLCSLCGKTFKVRNFAIYFWIYIEDISYVIK